MDGWIERRWMDGWMEEWMDGWMERWVNSIWIERSSRTHQRFQIGDSELSFGGWLLEIFRQNFRIRGRESVK